MSFTSQAIGTTNGSIAAPKFYQTKKWLDKNRPYYGCTSLGGCKRWALPAYIVDCESGGDYHPNSGLAFGGANGLLVSTWQQFGGGRWTNAANEAKPWQQDMIATRVLNAVGISGWECA
jgi:hypothetical protein